MKKLNLQIDKKTLKAILAGEQKVEHRNVYPYNKDRYVTEEESFDDNEELIVSVNPIEYDALTLVNGRKKGAPRITVEVVKSEFVILTDEDGNDLTYEQNGEEYYVCQVWYTLGQILNTENIPENF